MYCLFSGPLAGIRPHNATQQASATWHVSCRPSLPGTQWKAEKHTKKCVLLKSCRTLYIHLSKNKDSVCTKYDNNNESWSMHWIIISPSVTSKPLGLLVVSTRNDRVHDQLNYISYSVFLGKEALGNSNMLQFISICVWACIPVYEMSPIPTFQHTMDTFHLYMYVLCQHFHNTSHSTFSLHVIV